MARASPAGGHALMRKLRILNSYALIRLPPRRKFTEGGLEIPDIATRQQVWAEVVAVGPGRWAHDPNDKCTVTRFMPQEVEVGSEGYVGPYNGWDVTEYVDAGDDCEYWIVETLPGPMNQNVNPNFPGDVYLTRTQGDERRDDGRPPQG